MNLNFQLFLKLIQTNDINKTFLGGYFMGFEDELRKNTKSEEILNNERKIKESENILYMAKIFVRAFEISCQRAASVGKSSMTMGIPFHLSNQRRVYGGPAHYADNESYIADCYRCAVKTNDMYYPRGFFCPCYLQTFNVADKSASVDDHYIYPRSYANSLVDAIKLELMRHGFSNSQIIYKTQTVVAYRKKPTFFSSEKIITEHKPLCKNGVYYFYIAIKTQW